MLLGRGDQAVGRVEHEDVVGIEHGIEHWPGSYSCTPCSTATQLEASRLRCTKLSEPVISVTVTVAWKAWRPAMPLATSS